ncbi:MAG: hypothetical protein Q9227_009155 [Pyrenula ochraceoflavens]
MFQAFYEQNESDRFLLQWTFFSYLVIFEIGAALSGAASTSAMFSIGRGVSGWGAAGLLDVRGVGASVPFAILSGATMTVGSGFISTFASTTAVGVMIGYQIIFGFGRGISAHAAREIVGFESEWLLDPTWYMAMVAFAEDLGGLIFLAFDKVIFSDRLRKNLAINASGVNAQEVIAAGAAAVRQVVPKEELRGVTQAYSKTFDQVMYLAIGAAGLGFLSAFAALWIRVVKRKTKSRKEEEERKRREKREEERKRRDERKRREKREEERKRREETEKREEERKRREEREKQRDEENP